MNYNVYLIGLASFILFACVKKEPQNDNAFTGNASGSQTIDTGTSNNDTFIKTDFSIHITSQAVPVIRVKTIKDNFSFASEWHYNEFVYKTESGELHCDGICDPSIDTMYDVSGNVKKHLLNKYYSIVDTSHIYKTIKCDTWCYEYGDIDEILPERYNNGTV